MLDPRPIQTLSWPEVRTVLVVVAFLVAQVMNRFERSRA
jgi:hypothetical protein